MINSVEKNSINRAGQVDLQLLEQSGWNKCGIKQYSKGRPH